MRRSFALRSLFIQLKSISFFLLHCTALGVSQKTAHHREERLEFAPVERVEQPEFSKEEGTEGAPTSRDPGDDQLSEYDDDSSDNDSDDFAVQEDGAICDQRTRNSVPERLQNAPAQPLHVSVSFEERGISQ